MKRILNIIFLFPFICFGQKQGNIWYFGDHAGLDFNSGVPVTLNNGQTPVTCEGTAVMCDSSGALLFYTDGFQLWNKYQQVMPNGDSLLGDISSTQAGLIIPQPGSNEYFYVFTTDCFQDKLKKGLRYSVVDICLNNGLGDVVPGKKNILLLDTVAEKQTAVRHGNGTDYWIITHKYYSDAFYAFHLTSSGITDTVISHIGSVHPTGLINTGGAIGQIKASPDGKKLAIVNGNSTHNIAEYFDFNRSTGIVSDSVNIQWNLNNNFYGVSFSPDNSKLYIASDLNGNGIYQFDLNAGGGNPDSVRASRTLIAGTYNYLGLQLATDGKIYCAGSPFGGNPFLDVINNPNNKGVACNYVNQAISLNGHASSYGFPNFVDSYDYSNTVSPCCAKAAAGIVSASHDTICAGSPANLSVMGNSSMVQWQSSILRYGFKTINGADSTTHTDIPLITTYYRVFSGNGQCADTSASYKIFVEPSPKAVFTFKSSELQVIFNSDSSSSDVTSYSWNFGDGTTSTQRNPTHTFNHSDTFNVCLTVYNGSNCSFTQCENIDLATGIKNISAQSFIKLYPNPANNTLNLSVNGMEGNYRLKIYNVLGQQVWASSVRGIHESPLQLSIPLTNLPSGTYQLILFNNNQYYSKPFVHME